jgi:hypothetical protein
VPVAAAMYARVASGHDGRVSTGRRCDFPEGDPVSRIHRGRYTAEIDGDFVVFLIGARLNKPWLLLQSFYDLGGRHGMKAMLDELMSQPEKGLLGYRMGLSTIVQYWRSFEHLEAFARDPGDMHRPVWLNWYRRDRQGRTGIWHETYLVRAGDYEAIYGDVPEAGLAAGGRAVPLSVDSSARLRLRRAAVPEAAQQ